MTLPAYTKNTFTRFSFSGYKVVIIQDKNFKIDIKCGVDATQEVIDNNMLKLIIKDQIGKITKDTVYVYTDKIDDLILHNSVLTINETFKTDSLSLELMASERKLKIQTDYLYLNASGGSRAYIEGVAVMADWEVGAGSSVNAEKLISKKVKIDLRGGAELIINSQK